MPVAAAKIPTPAWLESGERRELLTKSLPLALGILAIHLVFYGVTLWGAVGAFPWWVTVPSVILNGVAIGMLFIIAHDASHGSFVPGRRFNQILVRVAFIFPVHSASLWDVLHNRIHHGCTNLKGFDCVWTPMSKADYDKASPTRRWLERVYRGPAGPLVYYLYGTWLQRLLLPMWFACKNDWRRHLPDTVFTLVTWAATLAGIAWLGTQLAPERPVWLTILLGWVAPYAIWNYLMGFSIYIHHTHPSVPWFDKDHEWSAYNSNIRGTTDIKLPVNVFTIWSYSMRHTAHHALPGIPVYKLPRAQERLLARLREDVVAYSFGLREYRDILRRCKLYDFDRRCWTDFDGRPTTDPVPAFGRYNAPVQGAAPATAGVA